MCSIIHLAPSLLHVVLINSLGVGALMACAVVVSKELECNTVRFTENGSDSSVFFLLCFSIPDVLALIKNFENSELSFGKNGKTGGKV